MKFSLLLLLLITKLSFATSIQCANSTGHSFRDGDEEFSRGIYFTVEEEEKNYRTVLAHIPIPKEYLKSKVNSAAIILFMPSISKSPLAITLTKYERVNDEIVVKFWGAPKTELEASVSVGFDPTEAATFCRSHLVSTYKFFDSTKHFRSRFD